MFKHHYMTGEKDYPEFAKNAWIRFSSGKELVKFDINFKGTGSPKFEMFLRMIKDDKHMLSFIYVYNELWSKGWKMIKMTKEQGIILGEIRLDKVGIEDYKQCYDTIAIEFPDDYREWLRGKYGGCVPPKIGIIHFSGGYILLSFYVDETYPIIGTFITESCDNFEHMIKEYLGEKEREDIDFKMTQDLIRVCINMNFMIMQFGKEDLGYENPKRVKALKREGKGREREEVYWVGLKQEIKLFEKKVWKERRGEREGEERARPRPYWRSGHLRRQRYGEGNLKVKVIFIRPVFCCSDTYKGDMSDTSVTFK